jgi:hypothetical protein
MLLPWLLPSIVSTTAWRWLFDQTNGLIDQVLLALHAVSPPQLPPDLVGRALALGRGVAGSGFSQSGAALFDADHPLPRDHPLREFYDTPVWLTVPLRCRDRNHGFVGLAADPAHCFTPLDAARARFCACLAALAIERTQLLERAPS